MHSRQNYILIAAICGLALLGGGLFVVLGAKDDGGTAVEFAGVDWPAEDRELDSWTMIKTPRVLAATTSFPTHVLWPLEVKLDLVEPSYLPRAEDGAIPGTGRRARIAGNIADEEGKPVRATIEFVAGANQGRVLLCDSTGAFGANDMYPGLAVVEVRGRGVVGSRREVVLRQNTEYLLNIGYGLPGAVQGDVVDAEGNGIPNALVIVDGQATRTSDEGYFYIGGLASDRALLEIEAKGYAGVREVVGITADFTIPRGRLVYRLEKGASIEIALNGEVGASGPAQVILLPADTKQQRRYPWYRLNPIEAMPGGVIRVDDLPLGPVAVRVFHRGALAKPGERVVNARSGILNRVEIDLEPAPTLRGVVTMGGKPVPGARVRLEAPDRVRATLMYFRTAHWFLESEILPPFPFTVQEVEADRRGQFALTSWADLVETRYLEAWSPDRSAWAGVLVGPDAEEIELVLEADDRGSGELVIELPGRTQGLDIQLQINGTPAEPFTLAPDEDLRIDDLLAGIWRVEALWYTDPVVDEEAVAIEDLATLKGTLPEAAITGQTDEEWGRAGREFPAVD